jgi:PIN domain nuclease of toxin-antitoxin system
MRLLLDTHVFLWSSIEPSRLAEAVAAELEDPANELWLSPISVWETPVLAEKGRIEMDSTGAELNSGKGSSFEP